MLLETPRLVLRPLSLEDLDEFVALHAEPEVTRFVTAFDRPESEERLRRNEVEWQERGHGLLAVLDRADGRFLGRAGFKYWPQFDETELGWALRREAWGHGYATEAAGTLLQWAFDTLDLNRVQAEADTRNAASARVLEKLGFVREGTLREDCVVNGEVSDSWVYGLLRRQWRPLS